MRKSRAGAQFWGIVLSVVFTAVIVLSIVVPHPADADKSGDSTVRIGLVLDRGGKNDNSFNSAAYIGAMRAKKKLHVYVKYVESPDIMAFESIQRALAKKKFNLIIAIGFAQVDGLKRVAKEFPKTHFVIVDGQVDLPNVKSVLFEEHEGSYLVGALAARRSQTHTIGFIGGMDIPLIRRFELGYISGAHEFSARTKILSQYIGITSEAWNNPAKAKESALSEYSQGADIVFVAAGASGTGVFDAAEETHHFAIGVDSDQNWMKPGFILTSMVKRVDRAVYAAIAQEQANRFTAGIEKWGLDNGGVDYALDSYNRNLIDKPTIDYLKKLKSEIISGKIVVPDYYKLNRN